MTDSEVPAAPEPRKPWEVLREAAKIMRAENHNTALLETVATRLEAAAAPKLPTLAEAVWAYHEGNGARWSDVMAALARENGA